MADAGAPSAPHGREMTTDLIITGVKMQRWKDEPMKRFLGRITHLHLNERGIGAIVRVPPRRVPSLLRWAPRTIDGAENDASVDRGAAQSHLEPFANLRVLYLYGNRLRHLSGLEAATALDQLHVQRNELNSLAGIERCTALTKLCVGRFP